MLKWLQERGTATLLRTGGADDPISFSNVFFFTSLATGLALALVDQDNGLDPAGIPRALLSVAAFAGAGVLNRRAWLPSAKTRQGAAR